MIEFAPFVMIVAIVAIVSWSRMQRARLERGDALADGEGPRLRDEVRQLKERIAVLERIVTDGDERRGRALEREIEALRDAGGEPR